MSGDVGESSALEPVTRWNGDLYLSDRYGFGGLVKLAFGESRPVEIKTADGTGFTRASHFVAAGDKLYFLGTPDNGTAGVFVTDGSSAGTRFVHGGLPLGAAGDVLIFRTTAGEPAPAASLWRTDGTPSGTFRIADTGGSDTGASLGGDFVFVTGTGVWKTDGTPEGTLPVTRDNYGTVYETRRVGDALYFTHASVSNGTRLIKTDGTAQGTAVAHTYFPFVFTRPQGPTMTQVGDTLYFLARGDASLRTQVYSTRGPGTTVQLTDLGQYDTEGVYFGPAAVGDRVFFSARAGTDHYELWETRGVPGDARRVTGTVLSGGSYRNGPLNLTPVAGSLFFTLAEAAGPAARLWRYGVTPAVVDPDGTLVVNGTDPAEGVAGDDVIALALSGQALTATVNGDPFSFPAGSVRRITVNGLGGDDRLELGDGVTAPVVFNASAGNETWAIDATDGDDTVLVAGDRLTANGRPSQVRFTGLDALTVRALGGNDVIRVDGTPATNVTVDAGDGDDAVTVRPTVEPAGGWFAGTLSLRGGAGANTLSVDNSLGAARYELSDTTVLIAAPTGPARRPVAISNFPGGVSLTIDRQSNTVRVTPSQTTPFSVVDAPGGAPFARDVLLLELEGVNGTTLERSDAPGAGRYTFANRQPVGYAGIEVVDDLMPPAPLGGALGTPGDSPANVFVTFSEPVALSATPGDALRLTNLTTGQAVDPAEVRAGADPIRHRVAFWFNSPYASLSTLPGGRYRAVVQAGSAADYAGNPTESDFTFEFEVAPRVTGVWADGTAWAPGFRTELSNGLRSPAEGVPVREDHSAVPVWATLDRVTIRFNGPVDVGPGNLTVGGVTVATYPVAGFEYDPATYTARWTLSRALTADAVTLRLDADPETGGVRTAGGGLPLDGNWPTNRYRQFPSGDGAPGGDFGFTFKALPGDATRDHRVNALDLADVRRRLNTVPPSAEGWSGAYSFYADLNGDGRINALDMASVRRSLGLTLPAAPPPEPPGPAAAEWLGAVPADFWQKKVREPP